nr:hypothetical protein CFP56_15129 [Quercus suber]
MSYILEQDIFACHGGEEEIRQLALCVSWYMNALVHHPLVILQTIWEAISYMMKRGNQSGIIFTGDI